MRKSHKAGTFLLVAAAGMLNAGLASAQTQPSVSQVPPGEQVTRTAPPAALDLRIGGLIMAPEGADTITLTLAGLDIEGALPELADTTASLAPQAGTSVTLAEVYSFAARLQEAYLAAGFPLVRVFVPVQDLDPSAARVRIKVISGFVGSIDLSGVPDRVRSPIEALTRSLIGKEPLRAEELERAVLLAGEVAGVSLRSTLMAGNREGETRLILTATHVPLQVALSIDNQLVEELGREQVTVSGAFNGLFGRGDRIGLTLATAMEEPSLSDDSARRYIGIYADTLVGSSGLALGLDAAISSSRPGGAAGILKLRNEYSRFGLSAAYPTVRSRQRSANTRLSFDFVQEGQSSDLLGFPVDLSRDELRIIRLQHSERVVLERSIQVGADLEFSQGLDAFGARTVADATPLLPLSRIGADAVFSKLIAEASVVASIPAIEGTLSVLARGQTAFDEPLVRSEQFSIATASLISGLPAGSVVGDQGWGARLQVERPLSADTFALSPYLFMAHGEAELLQPTALEVPTTRLESWGIGLRLATRLSTDVSAVFSLEWSQVDSNVRELDGDFVSARVTLRQF